MVQRDFHIEAIPDGLQVTIERDDDLKVTGKTLTRALREITLLAPDVGHLLLSQANLPNDANPADVEAKQEAQRVKVGKRITFACDNATVVYEVVDFDHGWTLLRMVEGEVIE